MKRLFFCFIMMAIVSGCIHYKNILNVDKVTLLNQSIERITCKAMVKIEGKTWNEEKAVGTSFSIGNGYSLALVHATVIGERKTMCSQFGEYFITREVKDCRYTINGRKIELVATNGDLALFKKSWEVANPFKLGKDAPVGTKIVVIGDSILNGNNTKTGIVSMLTVGKRFIKEFEHSFLHTTPINGGDSGSPVLAMNQYGEYEVVGIVNAHVPRLQGYSFAIKVSHIKEVFDEI